MKHRKQRKPSKRMLPSSETEWKRAKERFHLSDEQLAKAKAIDFTPAEMDAVATGRRIKRSPYDKLPQYASQSQIKKIKRVINERYAAWVEKNKGRPDATAKLIMTLPAVLKAQVEIRCAKEKVKLADELRRFFEVRFSAAPPEGPKPTAKLTTEEE